MFERAEENKFRVLLAGDRGTRNLTHAINARSVEDDIRRFSPETASQLFLHGHYRNAAAVSGNVFT